MVSDRLGRSRLEAGGAQGFAAREAPGSTSKKGRW